MSIGPLQWSSLSKDLFFTLCVFLDKRSFEALGRVCKKWREYQQLYIKENLIGKVPLICQLFQMEEIPTEAKKLDDLARKLLLMLPMDCRLGVYPINSGDVSKKLAVKEVCTVIKAWTDNQGFMNVSKKGITVEIHFKQSDRTCCHTSVGTYHEWKIQMSRLSALGFHKSQTLPNHFLLQTR